MLHPEVRSWIRTPVVLTVAAALMVTISCSSQDVSRGSSGSGVASIAGSSARGSSVPAPPWTRGTPTPADFPCDVLDPKEPVDGPLDPASLFHAPRAMGSDAPVAGSSIVMGPRDGSWRDVQLRVLGGDGIVELDAKQGDGRFIGDIARVDSTSGTYTPIFRAGCAFGHGRWYVDGGDVFLALGKTLSKIDLASGELRWTIGWDAPFESHASGGDLVLFAWDGKSGSRTGTTGMVHIDRATGQPGTVDTLESNSLGYTRFSDGWWWRRIALDGNATRLERVNPTTRQVEAQVEAPNGTTDLIVAEGGVWIADYDAHTLARADRHTLKPTTTVTLPGLISATVTPDGVWVQQATADITGPVKDRRLLRSQLPAGQRDVRLSRLDLKTLKVIGTPIVTTGWFVSWEPSGGNPWLDSVGLTSTRGGYFYVAPSPVPPADSVDLNMAGSLAMYFVSDAVAASSQG